MRIWLLTSELPHEAAGGIARYIDNFARLLGSNGHEVVIIARTEQKCDLTLAAGVRVIGIPARYAHVQEPLGEQPLDAHPAYPFNVLSYGPALSYQMAEEVLSLLSRLPPPDIIEVQEYGALPYYLLQRKLTERTRLEHIPILVHLHNSAFEVIRRNQEPRHRFPEYWVGQMEKFCLVAADALISPSAAQAQRMTQVLERSLTITHIPHPLTVRDQPVTNHAQPGELVYVGKLQIQKGVLPLVKACSRLWSAGEEFRLTLVGGDESFIPRGTTVRTFIEQQYCQWLERGQLRLIGQLDHAGVLEQMRRAWAVVIPSVWENFPNTCLEAMGVGQVVVASRAGGQVEMIEYDGVNGYLFDWEIPGDLERQLRTVLHLTAEQRRCIGQQAQTRIRTYCDPATILPRRLQHYEAVIAQHTPRRSFQTLSAPPQTSRQKNGAGVPRTSTIENGQPGLLSVVIPFYNLGAYLSETLDSICATTYAPYEVIVVNDGSTDPHSLQVLHEIEARKLLHIRVVHTENHGLATARNIGVEAARGEFVAFVDADDMVESNFFPRAIDVLQRYDNVAMVYPWLRYFGESTSIWPTWNAEFPYLLGHNMVAVLAVVRRTAFLRWARNQAEFEYNFEDYEGWVGMLAAGEVGVSLPHPLARYRVRVGSMYQSSNQDQQLYLYDLLTQRHAEHYQQWGSDLFNLQNANGPGYLWNYPALDMDGPPQAYVKTLQEQRDKFLAEAQTLGKAWEENARFIAAQREYIEDLEKRCHELVTAVAPTMRLGQPNGNSIAWQDYELGGRWVHRVRQNWLVRQALRSSVVKRALKKLVRRNGSLESAS